MPNIPALNDVRREIIDRHQLIDWRRHYPWWPKPAKVSILFYADGSIQYDGGPFFGLKQVLATITANHYPWVEFDVTTVHRGSDPSADHQQLDLAQALDLADFDELWIYSINNFPRLTSSELTRAAAFMDAHKGGVLITGDHFDLGQAFGNLPRAGKMRDLPAPDAAAPVWNTTLRSGADSSYDFDDQSDATPQPVTLRTYWAGPFRRAPHPVLCSPLGPIDIFPDHQHEGEAIAPTAAPASEWPGAAAAEVIAWGTIVDPSSDSVGRRIGLLSAYEGHPHGVGRVLADSTWHHHFDINLRGIPGDADHPGFVGAGGQWTPAARKIEHFFVNAAIWLAPPAKQAAMRAAAWWPILTSDAVIESLDQTRLTRHLGLRAFDALGRYAPQCTILAWVLDLLPLELRFKLPHLGDETSAPPVLEFVAGAATRRLIEQFGISREGLPREPPSLDEIAKAFDGVADEALAELADQLERSHQELRRMLRG